jgi:hypothetical protein
MSFLQFSNPSTPSSFLHKSTGSKIATIRIPSLSNETASKIKPEAFKELASYNWIDSDTPTIVAPGQGFR